MDDWQRLGGRRIIFLRSDVRTPSQHIYTSATACAMIRIRSDRLGRAASQRRLSTIYHSTYTESMFKSPVAGPVVD
jgi:hypothetical protein